MEFIIIGGVLFWILTVIVGVITVASVANERGWIPFWAIVIYLAVIAFFSPFNFLGFIAANPIWLLGLIGTYIIASIPAAWLLWRNFIGHEAAELEESKIKWLEGKGRIGISKVPEDLQSAWTRHLADRFLGSYRNYNDEIDIEALAAAMRPRARDHKSMVIFWISYWPLCILWELVGDWIVNISKTIYRGIGGVLDKSSERRFSGLASELKSDTLSVESKPKEDG